MKNAAAKLQYRVIRHEPFHSLVMSMCRYGVLVFAMLAIAGSAYAQQSCVNPSSGDGVDVPYATTQISQLQAITPGSTVNYVLCDSINATGTVFVPIGGTEGFSGTFDGNGMTIRNLTISLPSSSRVGLFGKLSAGGKIQNLNLVDVDVTGIDQVGGLVGESLGDMEGVSVTGTVAGRHQVGGLVGAFSNAILSVCESDVIVRPTSPTAAADAEEYLGGLVGQLSTATVSRCSATGDLVVSGQGQRRVDLTERVVGGLIGFATGSNVQNSTATGQINAGADTAGGLIGRAISAVISESHASGTVTASRNAGGLIGTLGLQRSEGANRNSTVLNSYSTGDVNAPSGSVNLVRAGGLIGELQEIWLVRNSYATGDIILDGARFGSLLGYTLGTGSVQNSFAAGSTEHKFIYRIIDSGKLTSTRNYYVGTQEQDGVTTVKLDQLECPTTPGTVCDGIVPFKNWDSNIWDFGNAQQLPQLVGLPEASTVQITVEVSGSTLGFAFGSEPAPVTASATLDPALDRAGVLRVTLTSGTIPVCSVNTFVNCVYLFINDDRTNTVSVPAGSTGVANLMLSLGIAGTIGSSLTGEFRLGFELPGHIIDAGSSNTVFGNRRHSDSPERTGKFKLDFELQGYNNEVTGNEMLLNFQQGSATMQPDPVTPESASLRMRVLLGGAVR